MPATIVETHGSRSFVIGVNSGSAVFTYFVFGETDEAAVDVLVQDTAPEQWYAYTRDNIDAKRRNRLDQWDVTVNYRILPYEVDTADLPTSGEGPSGDPVGNPAPAPSPSSSPPPEEAVLDGTNGDLFLTKVVTTLAESVFETSGKVLRVPGKRGRHITLTVKTPARADIGDVMRLLVDGERLNTARQATDRTGAFVSDLDLGINEENCAAKRQAP